MVFWLGNYEQRGRCAVTMLDADISDLRIVYTFSISITAEVSVKSALMSVGNMMREELYR